MDVHHNAVEESEYYRDLKLELEMNNCWEHFGPSLSERTNLYSRSLDSTPCPQSDALVDLMHDYSCLTSSGEKNKRECLRRIESKLAELPADDKVSSVLELDEDAVSQIHDGLEKTREGRFLAKQRLASEPAFADPWTGVETISLLRGVAKFGEHGWSEICDKYSFQSFRTPNSIAYKWSKLKTLMLEDIQRIHTARGFQISKWDWIQCYIHKLETKYNLFNPAPQPVRPAILAPAAGSRILPPQPRQLVAFRGSQSSSQGAQQRPERVPPAAVQPKPALQSEPAEKRPTALEQLFNAYVDCASKFKPAIEEEKFSVTDVRKYLSAKEAAPVYPKYFELHHYAPRTTAQPPPKPAAEEPVRRVVFRLCSSAQEKAPEESKLLEEAHRPAAARLSEALTRDSDKAVSAPAAEVRKEPVSMSLKKMFLHNKKALLNSLKASAVEHKDKQ